jgi:hypothetical protein
MSVDENDSLYTLLCLLQACCAHNGDSQLEIDGSVPSTSDHSSVQSPGCFANLPSWPTSQTDQVQLKESIICLTNHHHIIICEAKI